MDLVRFANWNLVFEVWNLCFTFEHMNWVLETWKRHSYFQFWHLETQNAVLRIDIIFLKCGFDLRSREFGVWFGNLRFEVRILISNFEMKVFEFVCPRFEFWTLVIENLNLLFEIGSANFGNANSDLKNRISKFEVPNQGKRVHERPRGSPVIWAIFCGRPRPSQFYLFSHIGSDVIPQGPGRQFNWPDHQVYGCQGTCWYHFRQCARTDGTSPRGCLWCWCWRRRW